MSTLRVLWVTDEVPDYHLGGGSIRQFHLLQRLSARADIDLLLVGELPDADLRRSLHRLIELEPPRPYGARWMWFRHRVGLLPGLRPAEVATAAPVHRVLAGRVEQLLSTGDYDIVHVEPEVLAPIARVRSPKSQVAWTINFHSLLSVRLRQWADSTSKPRVRFLLRRDARNADRLEHWIVRTFDQVLTVSPVDAEALGAPATVIPNGVDLAAFPVTDLPSAPRMILSGSWNWPPNVDAAQVAANEILPRVRARVPDATLALVGRQPPPDVRSLSSIEGVETHFDVPSVQPFLQASRVAVVPISVGSGTRLKALEAMAAGRPLVGTTIGLEGLDLENGVHACVDDSAEGMASAVVDLMTDDALAGRMVTAARRHVEEHFGWDAIAEAHFAAWQSVKSGR